jgi:hypothetical protein
MTEKDKDFYGLILIRHHAVRQRRLIATRAGACGFV